MIKCDKRRVKDLNNKDIKCGPIFYLMSREQRVENNWSLIFAKEVAEEKERQLAVVFFVIPSFLGATLRQYDFMLKGLQEAEGKLRKLNISFFVEAGDPLKIASLFFKKKKAGAIITDFDPLRIKCEWRRVIARDALCKVFEVDSHNIVPHNITSSKQEYGAYTIRPKIKKQIDNFLTPFPKIKKQCKRNGIVSIPVDWKALYKKLKINNNVSVVNWIKPGEKEAQKTLLKFIKNNLNSYGEDRNNPNKKVLSNLSPYIHFGQTSAQHIALSIKNARCSEIKKDSFLEELIVRKELADNFCFYNKNYDNFDGFPAWAKESLNKHKKDKRPYLYNRKQLEQAETHDDLWNASQEEMIKTGKMHGYLRMYWAKKILEWTSSPEEALEIAIYLNDKYELDGRDAKGYTGIAWSIGGLHDRAWGERPIFGKIRYMSYNGSKSKFNIKDYITKINNIK